jgi:hypothetical protein
MTTPYVPNNIYVFTAAFTGAQAGILGRVSQTNADTVATYAPTDLIAGAWAEAIDTSWGVATNPDLYQYGAIEDLSEIYWLNKNSGPAPADALKATYAIPASKILLMVLSGEDYLAGIPIPALPSAAGAAIVWRPGGTEEAGVALTWAQVQAFITASNVPVTVYVDDSLGAANVTGGLGTIDLKTTTFLSYVRTNRTGSLNNGFVILDGTKLLGVREIGLALSCQCDCATTAALAFNFNEEGGNLFDTLILSNGAILTNVGAVPAIQVPAGAIFTLNTRGGGFGVAVEASGSAAVINLNGTAELQWIAIDGLSTSGVVLAGNEASTTSFFYDNNTISDLAYAGATAGYAGTYTSGPFNLNVAYGSNPLTGIDPTAASAIVIGCTQTQAKLSGLFEVTVSASFTGATAADTLDWTVVTDDNAGSIVLTGAAQAGPGFFIPTGNGGITVPSDDPITQFDSGPQVLGTAQTTGTFTWSGIVSKTTTGITKIPFPLGNTVNLSLAVNRSAHAMTFTKISMSMREI